MQLTIFAGLSGVTYGGGPFELGHGIILRTTYAHLFAAPMMSFGRAAQGRPHPAPWIATLGGGFAHDIEVEIAVPAAGDFPHGLTSDRVVRLLASLLRLSQFQLNVPVLSDVPFAAAAAANRTPALTPFETSQRIVSADPLVAAITERELRWLRDHWEVAAGLVSKSASFSAALDAADLCTVKGRLASALLLAWGGIEGLFGPQGGGEITHRVAANIAAYCMPFGNARLEYYRQIKTLYKARSKVAHSAKDADVGDVLMTFFVLRKCLNLIINRGAVPSPADLEQLLLSEEWSIK